MSVKTKQKTGIARILELAGQKKTLLILSGTLSTVSVILLLGPYCSVYFVLRGLLQNAAGLAPLNGDEMIRWAVIGLVSLLAGYFFMYVGGMCSHVAAFRILYGIRVKLADHIGRLPLGFFDKNASGKIKKIAEIDIEKIELFIAHHLPDLVNTVAMTLIMIAAMFALNPYLGLAALLPIIIGFAAQFSMLMGKEAKAATAAYFDAIEDISASAVQYVRGMPSIKVFGQTIFSFRQFYNKMIEYRDFALRFTDNLQNGFVTFKTLLSSLAAFVLPVGIFIFSRDPDNIAFAAVLMLFLVFAPGVASPVIKLVMLANNLTTINEGVKRIDLMLAQAPLPEAEQGRAPEGFDIQFNHVSFSYNKEEGSPEVLRDVSFTAKQNTITALVGPSGSGKTTIAQLIPRFWDVGSGAINAGAINAGANNGGVITIGGVDIREIPTDILMDTVSFVFQDAFLFSDSVYNNILVGKPRATKEEVYAAAEAAQCREFTEALPRGFDTLIGEGGVYLSGGEEQRICVARALLKNAPILVLDEATAYADPENEYFMQRALSYLMKNKTVIIIAHRLSTIREAGNIIVLQNGTIAEAGTHDKLIEANGLYARMWEVHQSTSNWKIEK
ncbi:MAG: ABC transporter ATP-binding protein/permease [Treponema sp.]|nr:ABC transporter ATP-binding protein/permease [Treponema sp.]